MATKEDLRRTERTLGAETARVGKEMIGKIERVEEKLDAQGHEPTLKITSETSKLGKEIFRRILVMSVAIVGLAVAPMRLLP